MIFEPQWFQARNYLKCSDFTELFANTGESDYEITDKILLGPYAEEF